MGVDMEEDKRLRKNVETLIISVALIVACFFFQSKVL